MITSRLFVQAALAGVFFLCLVALTPMAGAAAPDIFLYFDEPQDYEALSEEQIREIYENGLKAFVESGQPRQATPAP